MIPVCVVAGGRESAEAARTGKTRPSVLFRSAMPSIMFSPTEACAKYHFSWPNFSSSLAERFVTDAHLPKSMWTNRSWARQPAVKSHGGTKNKSRRNLFIGLQRLDKNPDQQRRWC